MSKSEKRDLQSFLENLLKWKYQPVYQGNSWKFTITEQRACINDSYKKSRSKKQTTRPEHQCLQL